MNNANFSESTSILAARTAELERITRETHVTIKLNLDEPFNPQIETGLGFFNHMLMQLAYHARIGLILNCKGDTWIDSHHTVEDCAIVLGQAVAQALGNKQGIERFGHALVPMDEALARAVVDCSGRAYTNIRLKLSCAQIGDVQTENLEHFFDTFAKEARITLHLKVLYGKNNHHKAEAAFKACAQALKQAIARTPYNLIPSTKGTLV